MISFVYFSVLFLFISFNVVYGYGMALKDTPHHMTHKTVLTSIMTRLKWKTLIFLYDGEEQRGLDDLPELPTIRISTFKITPENLNSTLLQIHGTLFPDINIVLSGNETFIRSVMTKVDRFDGIFKITDFKHSSKWLILCDDSIELHDIKCMENVLLLRTKESSPRLTPLTLAHHPTGNVFTPVSECGADVSMCYFPNVKYGYNMRHIRVYMLPGLKFLIKRILDGETVYEGYAVDFLHVLANRYNFSFSIVEPADGSWGILHNGSWDGIIHLLQQKDLDVIGCCFAITEARASVVDFINPQVATSGFTVLYRSYPPSPVFTLTRPLHWHVYLVTLLAVGMMVAIFLYVDTSQSNKEGKEIQCNFSHSLHAVIVRALFKQGSKNSIKTNGGKVLVSAWWLTLVVLTAVYTANLAASYTAVKHIHPFTTYQELIESDFQLMVQLHVKGLIFSKFMTSEMALVKSLRKKFDIKTNELSLAEKVRRVKQDKFALLMFSDTAESLKADDCELETIQENLFFEHFAIAFPKQSYLRNVFEEGLYSLQDSGTLNHLWGKWYKRRNSTSCLRDRTVEAISTEMLAGGWIVLCSGICIASVVLVAERLYFMCRSMR